MELLESRNFCLWCQAWSHCRSTVQTAWVWNGDVWRQNGAWKGKLEITSANQIPHLSLTVSKLEMKVTPSMELHSCLAQDAKKRKGDMRGAGGAAGQLAPHQQSEPTDQQKCTQASSVPGTHHWPSEQSCSCFTYAFQNSHKFLLEQP